METPAPIKAVVDTAKGINFKFVLKIILTLVIIVLIIAAIYWYKFLRGVSWKNIKNIISEESKKYENPVDVERILMQGVQDILLDAGMMNQVRTYSKQKSIDINRVLVNNAIAVAKDYEYIGTATA